MKESEVRNATYNNIISIADELIREKGYHAFSYADIAGRLMIRNAAIHYYFPTKSDLGRAVIDEEMDRLFQVKQRQPQAPAEEQLKCLLAVFYSNSLVGKACLAGALMSEYATFEEKLQLAVQDLCLSIMNWLTDLLSRGQSEGSFHFDEDPSHRALMTVSSLLSSLLLNRVLADEQIFEITVNRMLEGLGLKWRMSNLAEWRDSMTPKQTYSYA